MNPRHRVVGSIGLLGLLFLVLPGALQASTIYTSSASFLSATTPTLTENYSTFTNGQDLSSGFSADGISYTAFTLTDGATQLDITNLYNSFSGESLGADHTAALGSGQTYFLGGESATLTFSQPVTAVGLFFNVNLDSGSYGFSSAAGSATTGSASYDNGTFVFAGLISSTPFSSITFDSTGSAAVFNIPEVLATAAPTSAVPEASSLLLLGIGLLGILVAARKQIAQAGRPDQAVC